MPVEFCALVPHEHVDNWNIGTCAWVKYHDDKTQTEEVRCAWIKGCINRDVNTSVEVSQGSQTSLLAC
jgi:hypothetical protein